MPLPRASIQAGDTCDVALVHIEAVKRAQAAVPDLATMQRVAAMFQVLADVTRARIVAALAVGELCVCDVAVVAGLSISAASHQLKRLRDCGVAHYRKDGRMAYYRLNDAHLQQVLRESIEHIRQEKTA